MHECLIINLGGIILQFDPIQEYTRLTLAPHFSAFLTRKKPDFVIKVNCLEQAVAAPESPDFSTDYWVLKREVSRTLFHLTFPKPSGRVEIYQFEWVDQQAFSTISFYSPGNSFEILPLYLDGWLTTHFLSKKQGALFHSCGVDAAGHGCLFSGVSGSGKSTTARLWREFGGPLAHLLGEERIAIRKTNDRFVMSAAPWYTPREMTDLDEVPMERIFILSHAPKNHTRRLRPAEAVKLLIPLLYLPFWDPNAMTSSLDFIYDLCSSIPCYEYGFTPDARAVDAVWQLIAS